MTPPIVNALTIDVEDYFHIHAFSDVIRPEDWDSFEPRVENNTHRILDFIDSSDGPRTTDHEHGKKPLATFFVLGWVAERFPELVREIHARGHELACHGYAHQRISKQTKKEFKEDVSKSKEILEDIIGTEVIGYRAPTYSINNDTIWALEILFELGFRYDSSIFPIKHDFYGLPGAPRFPFYIDFTDGDILSQLQNPRYLHEIKYTDDSLAPCALSLEPAYGLFEFPISTTRLLGRNFPFAGGGYFRLFPYWCTKKGFKQLNGNGACPVVFYVHPWELDSDLPKVNSASGLSRFRTYANLNKTEARFKRLLNEFQFAPLATLLKDAGCKEVVSSQ